MAVQTTLDHYYPADSIEAESWLHVQRYTHTHHVTWKHVAYAARYHALSSFLQSTGNSYPFEKSSPTPPSPTTSNSSLDSGSSSYASSTNFSTSPVSPSSSTMIPPPTPSEILYLPPRTLGDLEDVFKRLAMAYMLTHISYLRAGLRGSDFSKMKDIAFGGLKELLGQTRSRGAGTTSSSSSSSSSTTTTATHHHHGRSGSAERVSGKGRELLRMVEGREDWDGTVQADRYRRRGSVGSVGSAGSNTSGNGVSA
ncbi:hypothetical protein FRC19_005068 [Serendipita sp. 401]|nr:hypothetical protein FRC15_003007 [Serendipita sp. 397]KAG8794935.1 hypothetical protein FRC16_010289 [Serendipita sp. 398]KAG8822880.1 hypothetical protein FRC19_005068 [Serendipita sp. 401]